MFDKPTLLPQSKFRSLDACKRTVIRNKRRSYTRLYFVRKNRFKPAFDRKYAYCFGKPPKRLKLPRNRHEEAIWLVKSNNYYFDLDSVRVKYSEEELNKALRDKRLIPENVMKGKNPTNVWEIGRLNGNSLERVGHPTQKPLELIRRFVLSLSYPGSIVLDFFAGSGTTGRACIEEGRNSILIDNDVNSRIYFNKHLEHMQNMLPEKKFIQVDSLQTFYEKITKKGD